MGVGDGDAEATLDTLQRAHRVPDLCSLVAEGIIYAALLVHKHAEDR
jgi:hypothetical protein